MSKHSPNRKFGKELDEYLVKYAATMTDKEIMREFFMLTGEQIASGTLGERRKKLGLRHNVGRHMDREHFSRFTYVFWKTKRYPVVWEKLQDDPPKYVMVLLEEPYYVTVGDSIRDCQIDMQVRVRPKVKRSRKNISWDKIRQARQLYKDTYLSTTRIAEYLGLPVSTTGKILRNQIFFDPGYTVPKSRKSFRITIFGETKTLGEWADDPRCQVNIWTLYDRARKDVEGSEILRKLSYEELHPRRSLEIAGETKSIDDWLCDPRCEVSKSTIFKRLRKNIKGIELLRRKPPGRKRMFVDFG
jgi:hypothetical protein